jgi:hypothetical protein
VPFDDKPLKDQEMWAAQAMELFGDLYGGATAFQALAGIYKDADGKVYHDRPILIESYVERPKLVDVTTLNELLAFAQRMGKEARQPSPANPPLAGEFRRRGIIGVSSH